MLVTGIRWFWSLVGGRAEMEGVLRWRLLLKIWLVGLCVVLVGGVFCDGEGVLGVLVVLGGVKAMTFAMAYGALRGYAELLTKGR